MKNVISIALCPNLFLLHFVNGAIICQFYPFAECPWHVHFWFVALTLIVHEWIVQKCKSANDPLSIVVAYDFQLRTVLMFVWKIDRQRYLENFEFKGRCEWITFRLNWKALQRYGPNWRPAKHKCKFPLHGKCLRTFVYFSIQNFHYFMND